MLVKNIVFSGKLACVGSSLYLRAKFGNGYYLTMVKDEEEKDGDVGHKFNFSIICCVKLN